MTVSKAAGTRVITVKDFDNQSSRRVSCHRCRHYIVTWDVHQPYGCRAHGFKTRRSPALVVYESSGIECQLFSAKDAFTAKP